MISAPGPSEGTMPSTLPPRRTPASSSPRTAGWPIRSAASPSSFAEARMAASTRKKRATFTPSAAAARGKAVARTAIATRARPDPLKRGFGARAEEEGVLEEREIDTIAVFGLDGDPLPRAIDPEARVPPEDGVGGGREPTADHGVVHGRRHLRLEAHRVLEPVEPKVHLPDVHAIVCRGDKEQQRDEAPERGAAAATRRLGYHCDCAPSTMLVTSLSSAFSRPWASWPGS